MAGALLAALVRKSSFSRDRWISTAWIAVLLAGPMAIVADVHNARWLTFSLDTIAFSGFLYLAMFSGSA